MIKLEDFVSQSIKEIINGVVTAQEYAITKGADVNPSQLDVAPNERFKETPKGSLRGRLMQEIHFDIAVTATEGTQISGGAGILISVLSIGLQGKKDKDNTSVSRISFDVPILLPIQKSEGGL